MYAVMMGTIFITNQAMAQDDDDDDDDDDDVEVEEMDEEEWQRQMDEYSAQRTSLQARLDQLNRDIDALRQQSAQRDRDIEKCEADLLALAGMDKTSIADFRRKFEETEKRINNRTGTPAEARTTYFTEISNSRARCLPEFADRYASMLRKLTEWEGVPATTGTYCVVKGDCLWKIAQMKYGNPYLWPAIWDANRDGVANANELTHPRHKAITNPNLIYPGQCLRIPTLTDAQKREAELKARSYRRPRTRRTRTTTTTTDTKETETKTK
jgi:LysM repeat protein